MPPIRKAFTMKLKPKGLAEYKRHHDHIWPELVTEIEKSGIAQITIFEADPVLFLYSEIYDEKAWDKLWSSKIHDKWGEIMNPLMNFNSDGKVDSKPVKEVFHLETKASQKAAKAAPKTAKTSKTSAKTTKTGKAATKAAPKPARAGQKK